MNLNTDLTVHVFMLAQFTWSKAPENILNLEAKMLQIACTASHEIVELLQDNNY